MPPQSIYRTIPIMMQVLPRNWMTFSITIQVNSIWTVVCPSAGEELIMMMMMMEVVGEGGEQHQLIHIVQRQAKLARTHGWNIHLLASKLPLDSKLFPDFHWSETSRLKNWDTALQCTYCILHIHKKSPHLVLSQRLYVCENGRIINSFRSGIILFKWCPSPVWKQNLFFWFVFAFIAHCCGSSFPRFKSPSL